MPTAKMMTIARKMPIGAKMPVTKRTKALGASVGGKAL
jgi:hypothetical protein